MRRLLSRFKKGTVTIISLSLLASAIVGFFTVISLFVLPLNETPLADMRLDPTQKVLSIGDTFTVDVIVQASVPVNVFAGDILFDNKTLEVESIDYNTSIADLWAKKPWYSNGDGTLNFIGGTTKKDGFIGTDRLIRIHFKTLAEGNGALMVRNAQILQHDGLGTEAPLAEPIDALFTVQGNASPDSISNNLLHKGASGSSYKIVKTAPSPDLNGDGAINIADASIMLLHLGSSDIRYDLNLDGKVDLGDLGIILGNH